LVTEKELQDLQDMHQSLSPPGKKDRLLSVKEKGEYMRKLTGKSKKKKDTEISELSEDIDEEKSTTEQSTSARKNKTKKIKKSQQDDEELTKSQIEKKNQRNLKRKTKKEKILKYPVHVNLMSSVIQQKNLKEIEKARNLQTVK